MSAIVEIGVRNLFDYLDYRIPLNTTDNITIIHGPNGCGKTWILQLINAVFSLDYPAIRSAPFGEIEFKFRDGGHFTVRRHVEERPPWYQASLDWTGSRPSRSKLSFTYFSKRTKKTKEFSLGANREISSAERQFPLSLIERELPHLERIGPREWHDTSRNIVLTLEDILNIYRPRLPWISNIKTTPQWLLEVTKRVNVNFIQSQRLIRMPTVRGPREPPSRKDVTEMVELDSSELAEKISHALAQSVKIAQSRDRTFPTRLLRGDFSRVASEAELREELSEIEAKRQQLYLAGLLDEEESVPLPSKAMNDMEQNVLSLYLQDVGEKLRVFDDLQKRIATLMNLVNSKFKEQGKSLIINRDQGFLFKTEVGAGKTLRPAELSSGEQQQLVLFYELLFKTSNKSLVLIDEPEISLNVGWQRRFLDDLAKVIQLGRYSILMATHSPQIIHNRRDLAVPLSGGVKE